MSFDAMHRIDAVTAQLHGIRLREDRMSWDFRVGARVRDAIRARLRGFDLESLEDADAVWRAVDRANRTGR